MRHIFIINPAAGKQDSRQKLYAMAQALREEKGLDVECMLTRSPGHATALARAVAEEGKPVRLYACGGDGTVNEVANGIAGFENAAMTCIPVGTGNDFLKNFGAEMLPRFADVNALWNGPVRQLDLIECNGRLCLTIACSGVDARVAESVHRYSAAPLLSGRGSYLASVAVNVLLKPVSQRMRVTLDGETVEDDFLLVTMCNGRYYGGGSMPVPEARMDDGVLHTVLIRKISKLKFASLFGVYSAGNYKQVDPQIVRVFTVNEVCIQPLSGDIVTCLDGECFHSSEVRLRLSDKKLNFFGPAGCDPNATARDA